LAQAIIEKHGLVRDGPGEIDSFVQSLVDGDTYQELRMSFYSDDLIIYNETLVFLN
jgi:hypothetical protein